MSGDLEERGFGLDRRKADRRSGDDSNYHGIERRKEERRKADRRSEPRE